MANLFNLEDKIKLEAQKYYSDGSNTVTDEEFDEMVEELKRQNPDSELLKTGWGYDVNKDTTPGEKVAHKYGEAGSLEKARTWKEIPNNMKGKNVYVSLKLDGLSVVAYYEHGRLIRALTRGDGFIGIDITNKLGGRCIPNQIDTDFTGAVRGEIIMPYNNFEKFKTAHPEAKNPRNSTVGLIGANEVSEDLNYLRVYMYTMFASESEYPESMTDVVQWVEEYFDYTAPYIVAEIKEDSYYSTLDEIHERWEERTNLPNDGLVLTVGINQEVSGYISYDAIAFKFPAEDKITEVEDVLWEMSKTGYYVPRVKVRPVDLSGATVTYATAFNAKYIQDNQIGKGTKIRLTRSGEVIPYIKEVLEATGADLPDTCPECAEKLYWNGVHLTCINMNCPNMVRQDLLAWINNIAPLDDFGDTLRLKYIYDLYGREVVSVEDMMDTLELGSKYQQGGVQDNLFVKMIRLLHTRKILANEAIMALNIPRFGDKTSVKLARQPQVLERIMKEAMTTCDPVNLLDLNGYIGDANADAIRDNLWKFARLCYIWNRIEFKGASESKGKVAITGKLSVQRKVFEKELTEAGWTCGDISKETKFLITDNPNSSSSKNQKADKLGIQKITEAEFRKMYL